MSAQSILNREAPLTHVFLIRVELDLSTRLHTEVAKEGATVQVLEQVQALALKSSCLLVIERLKQLAPKGLVLELQNLVCRQDLERRYCYIYLSLSEPCVVADKLMKEVSECIRAAFASGSLMPEHLLSGKPAIGFELSRLTQLSHLPGPAHAIKADVHYVVETDVEEGWWDEITNWYAQEHLPGLASVPGCVVANRYLNLDAGPRSFACYDLVSQDVLVSPEWLAVRATPWSSKARPHFLNTKREVFPLVL